MGKHFNDTSNKNFKKILLKFLLFLIMVILIYLIYDKFFKDIFNEKNILKIDETAKNEPTYDEQIEIYETTEKVEIETILTVNGAEYLEITGVHINSDNPELSTVAAKLKNHSDQSYENVNLRISLFDKDNNEITFLDYKIDKIEANGEAATFAALKKDLSNCVNYSIALIK